MGSRNGRGFLLGAGVTLTFAAVTAALLHILPGPQSDADYLVIGSVATLVTLLVLFLVAAVVWVKDPNLFGKRRRKQ